jgi:hypothetical protein
LIAKIAVEGIKYHKSNKISTIFQRSKEVKEEAGSNKRVAGRL